MLYAGYSLWCGKSYTNYRRCYFPLSFISAFSRGNVDTTTAEDGAAVPDHAKRLKAVMHSVHTIKDIDIEFDSIYVTVFDEPTDPDEFIRKRGGDAFIKLLRDALPW